MHTDTLYADTLYAEGSATTREVNRPQAVPHTTAERLHGNHPRGRRALRIPGVRHVRRPAASGSPDFALGYVRQGPRVGTPALLVPGGPGLASVLPYRGLRSRAARDGLDVLMVEHRGVGLSRYDLSGAPLPAEALTLEAAIEDIIAVLDRERIDRVVLHGTSYGSYLVAGFATRHPERVAGMVLDSTVLDAHSHHAVREHARTLLWDGIGLGTAKAARMLREVVARGVPIEEATSCARVTYEFGGLPLLERLLEQQLAGRATRTWHRLSALRRQDEVHSPYVMELDPVGRIAFGELNYAPEADHGPFDPAAAMGRAADRFRAFAGEPFDLRAAMPSFDWPTVVLSGERDLRTPPPVAREAARLIPGSLLLPLADTGHSALDTHQLAALEAVYAVRDGELDQLPDRVVALRRRGTSRHIATMVRASLLLDRGLPSRRQAGR